VSGCAAGPPGRCVTRARRESSGTGRRIAARRCARPTQGGSCPPAAYIAQPFTHCILRRRAPMRPLRAAPTLFPPAPTCDPDTPPQKGWRLAPDGVRRLQNRRGGRCGGEILRQIVH
jgi:hypothetical protein